MKKFDEKSKTPGFISNMNENLKRYSKGLTILRSFQCPYTEKNVNAILDSARRLNIESRLIDLNDANAARNNPSPFGTFCIIYEGEIIAHHPISNTRFENIMNRKLH